MEMKLTNGFCELNDEEMMNVDGGDGLLAAAGALIVKGCTAVGTFCGATAAAPVIGGVVIVATAAAVVTGICIACNE